jgi:hypothetical protein
MNTATNRRDFLIQAATLGGAARLCDRLNDKPPRPPGGMDLADMRVIAAIDEAARTGKGIRI